MSAKHRIIPMFIPHLGCPHSCVFCNQRHISGKLEPATPESVYIAVKSALDRVGEGSSLELAFYGGSFTAISPPEQEALLKAADRCLQNGFIDSIRVSTRPDAIGEEELERLWKYGVRTIELGAQSMRDEVLASSGRGHTVRDIVSASHMIKSSGFKLILQIMTGLPGDDDDGALFSARAIAALHPDGVRIYPTVIIKDTALHGMWLRGDYTEHTVENAVEACSRIVPVFDREGIQIIRLGLNPSEELTEVAVAGGAYHPALGELVLSRVMLNIAREALQKVENGSAVEVGVHPARRSAMIGQKRENVLTLVRELELAALKVSEADVARNEVIIISVAKGG